MKVARHTHASASLAALVVWLAGAAATVQADISRPDFSRYDLILQRRPFGAVAAVQQPVNTAPMPPPEDAFVKNLRMVAITQTPAGVRVGLLDLGRQPQKSYFLYQGEMEDGIELVDADFDGERARLRKGSEDYWIGMNEAGAVAPAGVPTPMGVPGPSVSGLPGAATMLATPSPTTSRRLSYAERLRKRREAEEARMRELAARPQLAPADLEKTLQEYQMDVIRKGEPPLPIPLTQEMDDQLVKEGVLPPAE